MKLLLLYQRVIADGRNADDSLVLKKVLHNGLSEVWRRAESLFGY